MIISNKEVILNEGDLYETNFDAGGIISLLIKPLNFAYRDLFIQIDNITLKHTYSNQEWSFDYIDFIDDEYYQFSLDLNPGTHSLKLMGLGIVEFLVISEEDYDNDEIPSSKEIQLMESLGLDPIIANKWGYYELGEQSGFTNNSQKCVLNLFIPFSQGSQNLYINVRKGEVSELSIDGDYYLLKDFILIGNNFLQEISPDFHQISYSVIGVDSEEFENFDVEFHINYNIIPIICYAELRDSDGDSLKDSSEFKSGLNPYKEDSDNDGLPDPYDLSPLHKISINPNEFGQIIFPTLRDTTTICSIQIQCPQQNYMGKVLWRNELECTIVPGLRIFGNPSMDRRILLNSYSYLLEDGTYEKDSVITYNLLDNSYNSSGNGDFIPDSNDPSGLFTFIPLQVAEKSFDCDVIYEPYHPAKDDEKIDFRFDFI